MKIENLIFKNFLDQNERIVHVAHKHILVLKFSSAKTSFFGIMIPVGLYFLFPQGLTIWLVWAFLGFCGLVYHFIDWYFDVWLLTSLGVIDIERNGLFDVTSTRIEYHMIEGIAYNIKGVLQTLFNYGDITIDKLGAKTSVVLKDAASPKKLERLVMKFQERFVYEKSIRDHQALKTMLSDMIAYHVQNNKINNPDKPNS